MDTNETVAVNEAVVGTKPNSKIDKGDFTLVREDFSRGLGKGFSFWKKEYASVDAAKKHLSADGRTDGEAIVLALINQQMSNAARGKATSRIPSDDKPEVAAALRQEKLAKGETILVTELEAENYIPGTREKTSIPALWKELNELKVNALEAKKAGNMEEYEENKQAAIELKARIMELLNPSDDELDKL